jgi:hypothetical protein
VMLTLTLTGLNGLFDLQMVTRCHPFRAPNVSSS